MLILRPIYLLPPEVLHAIVDLLPRQALAQLLRTSRYFKDVTIPILYKIIEVKSTADAVICFKAIKANTVAADAVRHISLVVYVNLFLVTTNFDVDVGIR